jgi:geranylgeranyl diphosphate synthase, type II
MVFRLRPGTGDRQAAGGPGLAADLHDYLRSRQALVDNYLRTGVDPGEGCPAALAETMRYSLLAPGKRLRPLLVLMANEAAGGQEGPALPAAAAVELIHTYSLIHDDLPAMDDDDLRRGLPTCHKKFGEAMAILAGDALLTLAFEVLADSFPPATATACCRELARGAGAAGMVGGQVEDLACEKQGGNLEVLRNVHARKTGALFRACLRLGAWTAQGEQPGGPDPVLLDSLEGYGRCLGMIFQITDDLLDVESTAEQTGKRTQKDAARGKLTYPSFLGLEDSRAHAQELGRQAGQHLRPLGPAGHRLKALVEYILTRDR